MAGWMRMLRYATCLSHALSPAGAKESPSVAPQPRPRQAAGGRLLKLTQPTNMAAVRPIKQERQGRAS